MDSKMSDIYINGDGIVQLYLNTCMYIDMSKNIDHEIELLFQTLKKYNIYSNNQKLFIRSNNSFDNLVMYFQETFKSLSPRKKLIFKKRIYGLNQRIIRI